MAVRSDARALFLCDIITGAVEGGIGYWASCRAYRWTEAGTDTTVQVHELDLDGVGSWHDVDADVIARGVREILDGSVPMSESFVRMLRTASKESDAGYLDAGDCDAILQAGLFGAVVYG